MKNIFLAITLPLFIVACGSGGGMKSPSETPKPHIPEKPIKHEEPTKPTDSTTPPSKPTEPEQPQPEIPEKKGPSQWKMKFNPNGDILSGTVIDITQFGYKKTIEENTKTTDEINTIKIAGKEIELIPEKNSSTQGFYKENDGFLDEKIVSGNKYNYMRFGIIKDVLGYKAFSHGLVTPQSNIPTNIKARYEGEYVTMSKNSQLKVMNGYTNTFTADLDFSDKSFDIEYLLGVNEDNTKDTIKIEDASIDGNQLIFTGYGYKDSTKQEVVSNVKIRGHIFGDKYQEIGGTLLVTDEADENEKLTFVFGGKKVSEKVVTK